ncbi:UPF0236 family transposase-like protein [Sporosarcina pasteurii]|uniref:Uncharacterized protein n=1 Tax=Sporosarcina pasteurii TaxID=1474 RepID=A0A380BTB3_SPOPA|nr:UPF0236 family protein [Sporosarcina pasteurii]QBQ05088.1 hypothetical protein E2C16_05120 [Sporosarcina pasteurii]SUJ06731.1 Uncharacterised protein family (UPF0236) [Sporosarcina pasteurii]
MIKNNTKLPTPRSFNKILDRFHVAKDLKSVFKEHPRWHSIRIKLAKYNIEGLMTELNSAVGKLEDADLIRQYP